MKIYGYIVWIVIVSSFAGCKSSCLKKTFRNEALGDAYFKTNQYANAIKYYEKAYQRRKEAIVAFKLGESYGLNGDYELAEKCFAPHIDNHQSNAKYCKLYAKWTMCIGNYEVAKKWWLIYRDLSHENIDNRLLSCDSAMIWRTNNSPEYEIKNLTSLNTGFSEICPAFYPNGIVFASSRPGMFFEKESGATGEPYFDLYSATFINDSIFSKPSFFSLSINTPEHETAAIFDTTGSVIYYTKGETDTTNTLKIKILQSEKKLLTWSKPKQFMLNDSVASFGQPFMNKKGTVFVFSSNIGGGYGGTDLYISFKNDIGWTKPENLGPIINTPENEYYPFLTDKGDLYFTSDGHIGLGGYDIFVAKFSAQGWTKVENLKTPINSSFDDLSFIISPNMAYGYFSSNRKGGKGKEDLYEFVLKPNIKK